MSKKQVRLISFYLPQYHPIPENDAWWGTGFTEWTNVSKATPLFPEHHQPRLPADLGFYDLRLPEVRQKQAELARQAGIYGFCYYHYWFNGKQLLNRPFDEVLASGQPDFPFCLCWANENWTRAWDGLEKNVLIGQNYSAEDDLEHIRWLATAFNDPRYIRIDDKPVFMVYRVSRLPNPVQTTTIWREEARRLGLGEIYLIMVESRMDGEQAAGPEQFGFDASVEFQPDGFIFPQPLQRMDEYGGIFDYEALAGNALKRQPPGHKRFPCVSPGWDNSARRKTNPIIFTNATPEKYQTWLESTIQKFIPYSDEENLVFINAWNEWGEGAYLEPDQKWGHAYLQATRRALQRTSMEQLGKQGNRLNHGKMPGKITSSSPTNHVRLSVCIPAYNGAKYLGEAIKSVLKQKFKDFELLIVDDCSSDNTEKVVHSFSDRRMRYHKNPVRLGLTGNWNRCVELASGDYVCIFHQDDLMLPDNLSRKLTVLESSPSVGFVYSDVEVVDAFDKMVRPGWYNPTPEGSDKIFAGTEFFHQLFTGENLICCPSVVVKRSLFDDLGGFDARLPYTADWEMWLRVALHSDVGYIAEPLMHYRVHESNETHRFKGPQELQQTYLAKTIALDRYPELVPDHQKLRLQAASEIEKKALNQILSPARPISQSEVRKYLELAGEMHFQVGQNKSIGDLAGWFLEIFEQSFTERLFTQNAMPAEASGLLEQAQVKFKQDQVNEGLKNVKAAIRNASQMGNLRFTLNTMAAACDLLFKFGQVNLARATLESYEKLAENTGDKQALRQVSLLRDQINRISQGDENPQQLERAESVLQLLLESGDVVAAMDQHKDRLTPEVVHLIRADAAQAKVDGYGDLGLELDEFADSVVNLIDGNPGKISSQVDIVIPVYGQPRLLEKCVESVLRTAPGARLILVDDCSPGTEIKKLFTRYSRLPNVKTVSTGQNQGFIGACRAGAKAGSSPFILFLNSDTEAVQSGWLEALLPREADIAITGAKLLFPPDMEGPLAGTVQHAGVYRNKQGIADNAFYGQPADHPLVNRAHDVNAVTGACMLIRRSVWDEMKGFDTAFGRGIYEDVDLCWRVRQQGQRVWYEPAAALYHREHGSSLAKRTLHEENFKKNARILYERWGVLPGDEHLFYPERPAHEKQAASSHSQILDPAETLSMLLDADDLFEALEQHRSRLNSDLLALVDANARAARDDGDTDLAEGLEGLHQVISDMLQVSEPLNAT
jgi:GT2 family glycosyltransferase